MTTSSVEKQSVPLHTQQVTQAMMRPTVSSTTPLITRLTELLTQRLQWVSGPYVSQSPLMLQF